MNRPNAPATPVAPKTIRWSVLGAAAIATGCTMPANVCSAKSHCA